MDPSFGSASLAWLFTRPAPRSLARSLAKQSSHFVAAAAAAAVAVNVAVVVAAAILVVVFVVAVLILAKKERVLKNIEYYCIDEFPLQELAG